MKNIIITGATGIVGSHVLYNLLEKEIYTEKEYAIYLVVRPDENRNAAERLKNDVFSSAILPEKLANFDTDFLLSKVTILEGSLSDITIPESLGNELVVLHIAASVNLGKNEKALKEIVENNYNATHAFISKLENRIKKLVFVSTAFSAGVQEGKLSDDYFSFENYNFRNHYEEYKHKMELDLRELSKTKNFSLTIIRPSVICGRMIDKPFFVMNRYIVFYKIGFFFEKMVNKEFAQQSVKNPFKLVANKEGGLNLVPVDYVSRAILAAIDSEEEQINVASAQNVPNSLWISHIMKKCNINYESLEQEPTEKSETEIVYYKTVGAQISDYLSTTNHSYDTTKLRTLLKDVEEPDVTKHFEELYDYAHDRDFELEKELVLEKM